MSWVHNRVDGTVVALRIMAALGGSELVAMAGVMPAARDGYITSVSA